jgi:hypothetical protein
MRERYTYQVYPMIVQLGVKLPYSSPLVAQESLPIKGDRSLEHVIDGTRQFMSQNGSSVAFVVFFLPSGQVLLAGGIVPQA